MANIPKHSAIVTDYAPSTTERTLLIQPPNIQIYSISTGSKNLNKSRIQNILLKAITNLTQETSQGQSVTSSNEVPTLTQIYLAADEKRALSLHTALQKEKGYVVAASFWDQQTFSMSNILSLQCWAAHVDMLVPEPFMIESRFKAPLEGKYQGYKEAMLKLSDLYNLRYWNDVSKKLGYAPLVAWQQFLDDAPRQVILVDLMPFTRKECSLTSLKENYMHFLNQNRFEIVRSVCLEPKLGNRISVEEFTRLVFQNYSSIGVTVIVQEWSFHTTDSITDLGEIHCPASYGFGFAAVEPSYRVMQDVNKYVTDHLSDGNYNTVLVRLEWLISGHISMLKESVPACLQKTMKYVRSMQYHTGVQSTFLGVDVGKFGSKSLQELRYIDHSFIHEQVEAFIKSLYGSSSSLDLLEQTFQNATKTDNAGYIGFLQKVIGTRGKCILLVGNGTFHKHALVMYRDLHRGHLCYAVINTACHLERHEGLTLD